MGASYWSDGAGGRWPYCTAGPGKIRDTPLRPRRRPSVPPWISDEDDSTRRLDVRDFGSSSASVSDHDSDLCPGVLRGIACGCPAVASSGRHLMSAMQDAHLQYVALRRALGTKLYEPAMTLVHFVEFLEREGAEFITSELALRWAMEPKHVQRATWARRLGMVRRFASWLSTINPRTEVPPRRLLAARRRRNKPHIFTEQEITRLMDEAAKLGSPSGLRALTFVTLIGLLSATGLRPGEALALDTGDVDLQNGILAIRESKFGKSRFVPVEDSTRTALARYAGQRDKLCPRPTTEAFLVSERGKRVPGGVARRTFARMSCSIGLRAPTGSRRIGRGPRLQDFRHSFATRRLIQWYRAGLDVGRELPKLATYLGHVDVGHTYWYIEAVPELLQLATERLGERPGGER